jgi:hypothetical protein
MLEVESEDHPTVPAGSEVEEVCIDLLIFGIVLTGLYRLINHDAIYIP